MNKKIRLIILMTLTAVYIFSILFIETHADPVGATITNITTVGASPSPDSRSDEGGSITTLLVSATQQNFAWKAYIGNISGTLTLDDSNGNTIYDWTIAQGSISGEIYATRFSSILWTNVTCANQTIITTEETEMNMGAADVDNINHTFSFTKHPSYTIAGTVVTNSTCQSLYTYMNQTAQNDNESSFFSEIIIQNTQDRLIYVGNLESDVSSYGSNISTNVTYDFQIIVADNDAGGNQTTYYFYAELDS